MEDKVTNATAACARLPAQIDAVKPERMSLRVQCYNPNQDCAFIEAQIGPLRAEWDQSKADVTNALATIANLILQMGQLTPLEAKLKVAQDENVALRIQIQAHAATRGQLRVVKQEQD